MRGMIEDRIQQRRPATIAEKDERSSGRDLRDRLLDIGAMPPMHNHAGGEVALAEDRLNSADACVVCAEGIGINFDTPAWPLRHHVEKGAMVLDTPRLGVLILRQKTVEGLLTIVIIVLTSCKFSEIM